MNRSQSRRECEALVARLDLPVPFDLGQMCALVGQQRGHPIVLMPTSMSMGSLCGLWLGTAKADYVFYEHDTSRLHQQHIICHEIGHILRRHSPNRILGADVARALTGSIEVGNVQHVLGRDTYTDHDEYEAELVATLILRRIGRRQVREVPTSTDPRASEIVSRISYSLSRGER